jgi:hypothetical protein
MGKSNSTGTPTRSKNLSAACSMRPSGGAAHGPWVIGTGW